MKHLFLLLYLKDLTQVLDPYKRNPSDCPVTTLNHLIHCYDRTPLNTKLPQTLDVDSQRITQSSQSVQSALESMNTLFNTFTLP